VPATPCRSWKAPPSRGAHHPNRRGSAVARRDHVHRQVTSEPVHTESNPRRWPLRGRPIRGRRHIRMASPRHWMKLFCGQQISEDEARSTKSRPYIRATTIEDPLYCTNHAEHSYGSAEELNAQIVEVIREQPPTYGWSIRQGKNLGAAEAAPGFVSSEGFVRTRTFPKVAVHVHRVRRTLGRSLMST